METRNAFYSFVRPAAWTLIYCVLVNACSATSAPDPMPTTLILRAAGSTPAVTSGALQFRVTSSTGANGSVQVDYSVVNASNATQSYDNGGCRSDVRLYDARGSRVFSEIALQRTCAPEGLRFVLLPGDQGTWHRVIDSQAMLESAARGAYTLAVTIPNVSPELEMTAGMVSLQ